MDLIKCVFFFQGYAFCQGEAYQKDPIKRNQWIILEKSNYFISSKIKKGVEIHELIEHDILHLKIEANPNPEIII